MAAAAASLQHQAQEMEEAVAVFKLQGAGAALATGAGDEGFTRLPAAPQRRSLRASVAARAALQ